MATEIGTTLRETRTKRRIELTEAEASTKIRIRFLRAMENEEWDVLPGDSYTRGFIRTYARYLGLDGEQLADQYRKQHEGRAAERPPVRGEPTVTPRPSEGQLPSSRRVPSLSRGAWATLISAALIAILLGVALAGGGDEGSERRDAAMPATSAEEGGTPAVPASQSAPGQVTLSLTADAEVWVCLLDADEEPLVEGEILTPGAEEGPFRSSSFTMSFGNGEVELLLDGEPVSVQETPSPIGYRVQAGGELQPLAEEARPTCL